MAMMQFIPFDKIISKADLAFLGTVVDKQSRYTENPRMIDTDVTFSVDRVLFVRDRSTTTKKPGGEIILTFAGGETPEGILQVSDVPDFEMGSQYIVLAHSNGKSYMSPIIGGNQGLFKVVHDEKTAKLHPLTYDNRIIAGVDKKGEIMRGSRADHGIAGGKAKKKTSRLQDSSESTAIPQPVAGSGALSASRSTQESRKKALINKAETLMTLDDFVAEIERMHKNEVGQ